MTDWKVVRKGDGTSPTLVEPEKVYVQNRIWEKRADVIAWLDNGAAFYVCGDMNAMAKDVRKVLASAIANAENNHNLDVDALVVAEASVGKSITMKRFATRGRGKSTRILKPFSRLRIVVREQEEA